MTEMLQANDPVELGRYLLSGRLGRGGMGTVFLGEDPDGHRVAVKVINPELADDPVFRERFVREVEAARRVRRFCTAPVLDASLDGEEPIFVVTEFIDGPTLDQAVERSGALRGSNLDGLAVGVATALSAIHDAGIVHRDLKPANVLLSAVGPRVIDFGIARALDARKGVTTTGHAVGTPAYMAPELLTGGAISPASDVFSWGCVIAFAGLGDSPFDGRTVPEVLYKVVHEPPGLDGLDPSLRQVVAAALAKNPADRPTVPQLLELLAGHRPQGALGPGTAPRTARLPRSERRPRAARSANGPHAAGAAGPAGAMGPGGAMGRAGAMGPGDPAGRGGPGRPVLSGVAGLAVSALAGALAVLIVAGIVAMIVRPWADDEASANEPPASGDVYARYLGTWTGKVDRRRGTRVSSSAATMTIARGGPGQTVGTSDYPALNCNGGLKLLELTWTDLRLEEHIGQGACTPVVTITLRSEKDGTLTYSYRTASDQGSGRLRKVA
ncbi:serine/threonine-protein kinase [Spirillospora sp. NPDC047279]|uniref:serine/threonine-protein kinase n=1 Tax=Spirillospora sp. NPDC047279 TaxID=3155478 RepID=UPI0034021444